MTTTENHLACSEHLLDHAHPKTWYTLGGQLVEDLCCIAHMNVANGYPCTRMGLVLPFANGFLAKGVKLVNFEKSLGFSHGGTSIMFSLWVDQNKISDLNPDF